MNIRVDLNYPIKDGTEVLFRSPVDCSQVTGLKVYYPENGATVSKEFAFADAHGNNVGDIDYLFAENVVVKVILDVTTSMAFVQNADTNAYLEGRFEKLTPLVVTIREDADGKLTTSHGGEEIYAHCNGGGEVVIDYDHTYWSCDGVFDNETVCHRIVNRNDYECAIEQIRIWNTSVTIKRFEVALKSDIGDISTALDELHAYAQALIGGE